MHRDLPSWAGFGSIVPGAASGKVCNDWFEVLAVCVTCTAADCPTTDIGGGGCVVCCCCGGGAGIVCSWFGGGNHCCWP